MYFLCYFCNKFKAITFLYRKWDFKWGIKSPNFLFKKIDVITVIEGMIDMWMIIFRNYIIYDWRASRVFKFVPDNWNTEFIPIDKFIGWRI